MIANFLIRLIKIYQKFLSPIMGGQCRFYTTCSNYGIEAIKEYGALKGSFLTIYRILRCNPFCKGGFDPVIKDKNPENKE